MKTVRFALFGLVLFLGTAGPAAAGVCGGWRRFTVITAPYAVKKFACEQCFGDAVQTNALLPDFCPSVANDVCQGVCRGTTTPCVDDVDCAPGVVCDGTTSDGVVVKCYGSGNDNVAGNPLVKDVVDLGGGDDSYDTGFALPLFVPGDVVQGGTGHDVITIREYAGTPVEPSIVNGGPIAAFGPDVSGDDTITDRGSFWANVVIGGGGRDRLKGYGFVGTTSYGLFGLPFPPIADDTVGSLLCGGKTVYAAGARHMCIQGGQNCYYVYDYAVQGGRLPESTDIATVKGCGTFTKLTAGGNVESPSKASCGCD